MSRIRVIDFETTGRAPPEHGIVEIGWCDVVSRTTNLVGDPADWEVTFATGVLCNPGRDIPVITSSVHNIVDSDVRDRRHWRRELRDLMAETAALPDIIALAAHSADAEQKWFDDEIAAPVPWLCTYRAALRVWPEAPGHSNANLRYWRMPDGMNRMLALPQHRAQSDAYVTAFTLRDLLNSGAATLQQMLDWSKQLPLTVRCYISNYRRDGEGTPWAEVESSMLSWIIEKNYAPERPEIQFTARHHLELRAQQARDAEEALALNRQLQAAGLPEEPIAPELLALVPKQESFL